MSSGSVGGRGTLKGSLLGAERPTTDCELRRLWPAAIESGTMGTGRSAGEDVGEGELLLVTAPSLLAVTIEDKLDSLNLLEKIPEWVECLCCSRDERVLLRGREERLKTEPVGELSERWGELRVGDWLERVRWSGKIPFEFCKLGVEGLLSIFLSVFIGEGCGSGEAGNCCTCWKSLPTSLWGVVWDKSMEGVIGVIGGSSRGSSGVL